MSSEVIAGLVWAIFVLVVGVGERRRGFKEGREVGYQEGFEAGRMRADDWWMNLEYETLAAQKQIRQEEG